MAGVNTLAGIAVAGVRGGGIAWWVGTKAGTLAAHWLDTNLQTSERALNYVYGDADSMTPAEAARMSQRVSNPITFAADTIGVTGAKAGAAAFDSVYSDADSMTPAEAAHVSQRASNPITFAHDLVRKALPW
jgi:hypothetical protein